MVARSRYAGIIYMLLACFSFSLMSGFAKVLKTEFNAPQLVFYRNLIGMMFLGISFLHRPPQQSGGKLGLLAFRGLMGTFALYTLIYLILHIPLGAAMTYNSINTFYIAGISALFFNERLGKLAWGCIVAGFTGILLIYKPHGDFNLSYHAIGILHGLFSAFAYLSIGKLNKHYEARVIVLSFLTGGLVLPLLSMGIGRLLQLPYDDFFFPAFKFPEGWSILLLIGFGLFALLGQYFVTRAYSSDKAGIVAAIGYSNIVFAMSLGIFLGDAWPDIAGFAGLLLVIGSGVLISFQKRTTKKPDQVVDQV